MQVDSDNHQLKAIITLTIIALYSRRNLKPKYLDGVLNYNMRTDMTEGNGWRHVRVSIEHTCAVRSQSPIHW